MDFRAKCDIIERIKDEVGDLHPLLHSFLDKLENIKRVEYTHGPNEKGADFVLYRFDPALSTFSHIGVIAKVGKIQQDLSELERQIDECGLKRKINGGRDEVRLSEIWVVNTSTISNNAKEKIHDKFGKQRIEFINGEHLTKLVDKHAAFYWHDIPSVVGRYLQEMGARIAHLDRDLNVLGDLDCEDFFIEPDIQEFEALQFLKQRRAIKPRYVRLEDVVLKEQVVVLEAEMGFGKSKAVRNLAQSYCAEDRFNHSKIVPVFLPYRQFVDQFKFLKEMLQRELGALLSEIESKKLRILVVLDGIDEATHFEGWQDRVRKTIQEARATERLNLVLTSRPLHVLDESLTLYQGAKRLLLHQLSLRKLVQFVEKACAKQSLPKKLFDDLQHSELFRQLPQSPIAAALLSRLLAQNQHDLPANLTELYSKSVDLMLGRWDVQKKAVSEKDFLAIQRATLQVAEYMLANRLIWMSLTEARQIVQEWHSKRNTGVDLNLLLQRTFGPSSVFAVNEDAQTIAFRHRSFGEFLFARQLQSAQTAFSINDAFEPYWIYVHFFHLGLIGDCPEHLSKLMAKLPQDEVAAWLKILVMPDYFLACHQTEYRLVEENLYKLFIDAASLYLKIKRGETKTKLGELAEMRLLFFFQRLIRYCYDYEFFRKAITPTILKLDEELLDPDTKYLALYFAACFAAELNDNSGFEFLIKTYGTNKLPVPISIAIDLEQKTNKDFSKLPLVKRHERELKALLMKGRDEKDSEQVYKAKLVADLFDRPLKARALQKPNGQQ